MKRRRRIPDAPRRTGVYRCYDSSVRLLYVGVSGNPKNRVPKHRHTVWFPRLDHVTVEWFSCRAAALRAERVAIAEEIPEFNRYRYGASQTDTSVQLPPMWVDDPPPTTPIQARVDYDLYGRIAASATDAQQTVSEQVRIMLAYAEWKMPRGWRPQ